MMAVSPWLTEVGRTLGVLAGVCVAIAVVGRAIHRPFRWVYAHLVGDPVGMWLRGNVEQVIDDKLMKRNGGTTIPDVIHEIDKLNAIATSNSSRIERIEVHLDIKETS